MATRLDVHQSSTRNQIFFTDTDMGRQLHPSQRQGNAFQTLSLIRQDVEKNCNLPDVRATPSGHTPYYGIYVQQKCNHPDARVTLSGHSPDMVLRETHYGKLVVQLSVRTSPRENRISVDLSLL
jgi:hypothetical protein